MGNTTMTYVDVTRLANEIDPFDFSASRAERGDNAGKITWNNALATAGEQPLDIDDRDGVREFFAGFGAWDREEIAAWSDAELDALVLQLAAGDLRELQSLHPGDGVGDVDWDAAYADDNASGRLCLGDDDRLLVYCGE